MEFNDNQQKAIEHGEGPALVVAGAGTGKTSVVVERIAQLIESGVDKSSILALTFTEKATQEMVDRVGDRLNSSYGIDLNIFTFNAFGQEMLREFATDIGLSSDLKLVGDTGKIVLLRENLDELELDYYAPISSPESQLGNLSAYFSQLKQQLVDSASYKEFASKLTNADEAEQLEKMRHQELAHAFEKYLQITRSQNIIDYDDQIYLLVELLEMRPNILKTLHARFSYILVDEFQDTNPMQSRLIELLAGKPQNVMVVGDDDQSIYGWRGATLSNILEFTSKYNDAKEITLVDNYRSSQSILDASYALIQNNNPNRLEVMNSLDKKLRSHSDERLDPRVEHFPQLSAEETWIANDIARRIKDGQDPSQIAVLVRRNQAAQRISEALEYHGVEHVLAGIKTDIYRHPMVAAVIEALNAATDVKDTPALYHTLTGPLFSVEAESIAELSATAQREHTPLESGLKAANVCTDELSRIETWRSLADEKGVSALAYQIIDETGLKDSLYKQAEQNEDAAVAVRSIGQWFESLREFQSVSRISTARVYLENIETLQAEGEALDEAPFDNSLPVVMSVHKAKGLEWDTVYIADCTEYSFPLRANRSSLSVPEELVSSSAADDHMAEERRLMYVAATRARKELIFTHSETHTGTTKRKPSRFLIEMFGEDLGATRAPDASDQTSLDLFAATPKSQSVGLPATMTAGDDLVLTASQLNDYMRCPLDFYYRHLLGVPAEPSPAASIGTLFHSAINQIHQAKLKGSELPSLESLIKQLEDSWPQEGFTSAKQRDRAKLASIESLKKTYERIANDPVPIASETPFRVRIPDTKVILRGRIDAVVTSGAGVRIVDYKTSTSATTPEKAKRSATSSKQLEMYALAWREQKGEAPDEVALDFVQTDQIGVVKKKSTTLDKLAEKIGVIETDIRSGSFPPGRSHDFCRHK